MRNQQTAERYINNIAYLISATIDKKIKWKQNSKTSFYWESTDSEGNEGLISIQKIGGKKPRTAAQGMLGGNRLISQDIVDELLNVQPKEAFIFQVTNKSDKDVLIELSTAELNAEETLLLEAIPKLYFTVEDSFNIRGADFFDNIIGPIKQ